MKLTLLEMVQDILSDMSGDYANSIGDTEESLQVLQILKSTYNEMMTRRDWPHLKQLLPLQSYGDSRYPTMLILPKNTRRVEWITYNQRTLDNPADSFSEMKYMEPSKFIQWTNSRNISTPSVRVIETPQKVPIKILTDTPPTYWTSFDDEYIFMDSFVEGVENTLQGSQSQCEVFIYPEWRDENNFVPFMPAHLFPGFLAEAKSTCFYVIKKMANEKAEQQSTRQQNIMSMQSWRTAGGISYPNYGRKQWTR